MKTIVSHPPAALELEKTVQRRAFLRVLAAGAAASTLKGVDRVWAEEPVSAVAERSASIRFPRPLLRGDVIGVTSPSAGVKAALKPRMQFAYSLLQRLGYDVREGRCLWGDTLRSASAARRARELQQMLLDESIAAVMPPNGGELLIDILPLIDFERLARAEPKWILGYSDLSTFLFPYTLMTHIATLNGTNLWEAPIHPTDPNLAYWNDIVSLPIGARFTQTPAMLYQPHDTDWSALPHDTTVFDRTTPVKWKCLRQEHDRQFGFQVQGRLIGGTLDVIMMLCGSPWGDVSAFARRCAPEGLLIYLDNCDFNTAQYCRALHQLRHAGWFDRANALLIGRTSAEAVEGFTQRQALLDALGTLPIPVVYDMDIGHLPPQLILVNGANATLNFGPPRTALTQTLA
jgi:muramoyltetrapeptide carboxypeptidase LdcA involved in peptidoglycan recycling